MPVYRTAIEESLTKHPALTSRLLVPENEEETFAKQGKAELKNEGGFLCPSKVAYGRVKKAKSQVNGQWKWIVNHKQFQQTLRMEKCLYVFFPFLNRKWGFFYFLIFFQNV